MLTADGEWYWRTLWPGNERISGWGPDDEPHVHWDVFCENCANSPFDGSSSVHRFNKMYLEDICFGNGCAQPTSAHQATRLSSSVWKYDIIVRPTGQATF